MSHQDDQQPRAFEQDVLEQIGALNRGMDELIRGLSEPGISKSEPQVDPACHETVSALKVAGIDPKGDPAAGVRELAAQRDEARRAWASAHHRAANATLAQPPSDKAPAPEPRRVHSALPTCDHDECGLRWDCTRDPDHVDDLARIVEERGLTATLTVPAHWRESTKAEPSALVRDAHGRPAKREFEGSYGAGAFPRTPEPADPCAPPMHQRRIERLVTLARQDGDPLSLWGDVAAVRRVALDREALAAAVRLGAELDHLDDGRRTPEPAEPVQISDAATSRGTDLSTQTVTEIRTNRDTDPPTIEFAERPIDEEGTEPFAYVNLHVVKDLAGSDRSGEFFSLDFVHAGDYDDQSQAEDALRDHVAMVLRQYGPTVPDPDAASAGVDEHTHDDQRLTWALEALEQIRDDMRPEHLPEQIPPRRDISDELGVIIDRARNRLSESMRRLWAPCPAVPSLPPGDTWTQARDPDTLLETTRPRRRSINDFEILENWSHSFPDAVHRPLAVVVKLRGEDLYLRHSRGPLQNHFLDMYPEDYQRRELAELAISMHVDPPTRGPRREDPPAAPCGHWRWTFAMGGGYVAAGESREEIEKAERDRVVRLIERDHATGTYPHKLAQRIRDNAGPSREEIEQTERHRIADLIEHTHDAGTYPRTMAKRIRDNNVT